MDSSVSVVTKNEQRRERNGYWVLTKRDKEQLGFDQGLKMMYRPFLHNTTVCVHRLTARVIPII
jgi:hypothetical protein